MEKKKGADPRAATTPGARGPPPPPPPRRRRRRRRRAPTPSSQSHRGRRAAPRRRRRVRSRRRRPGRGPSRRAPLRRTGVLAMASAALKRSICRTGSPSLCTPRCSRPCTERRPPRSRPGSTATDREKPTTAGKNDPNREDSVRLPAYLHCIDDLTSVVACLSAVNYRLVWFEHSAPLPHISPVSRQN
uniref:Uncharacterized protein n=1 Tax=Oryza nivara TaxID=4536 RepID=A0A0E0G7X0_ORYNI